MNLISRIETRWHAPGGYREALHLAFPLILSAGSWTVQHFVDRMFLCWWSPDAMGASLAAGVVQFTAVSLFMGTASYANTFVAQYFGAKRPERIGAAVWQSIYFAAMAFAVFLLLIPLGEPIFTFFGHEEPLRSMEIDYFQILLIGSGFHIYSSAVSGFYSGRGRTWPILYVNATATAINLVLDYAVIFGNWGFPEMGLRGAAWATNAAMLFSAVAFSCLFFSPYNRKTFATARAWRFDPDLFGRLMRYGFPSGLHFMADMFTIMLFVQLVGRIGANELSATTLAFNVNMLAFLPMIGFGIATSTLVGQRLGSDEPDLAAKSAHSVFHLTLVYMGLIALLYIVVPGLFIEPFGLQSNPAEFSEVRPIAYMLLRFVAFYCLFDTLNIIYASALKGAGDTRFVMWLTFGLGFVVMVIPTYLATRIEHGAILLAWTSLSAYVVLLGLALLARFHRGTWRSMRVIEAAVAIAPAAPLPETPTVEVDM